MKILVVDDEKVLVKGIKFNLENEGYQVEVGYDGQTAVDLAREGAFDLILLDLMMPGLDAHSGIFRRAHYHPHCQGGGRGQADGL